MIVDRSPAAPAERPATRREFIHIAAAAAAVGAAGGLAWPLIDQMSPAADTLALASIEVDYAKVAPGQQIVVKWRGRPLFIRRRTAQEIAAAVADDDAPLRDPATDASRHMPGKPQWLVLIGVCTHLGCVPTFGGGDYGGWFCPCHGSHYDTAGRIRRGPAPRNLDLPDYAVLSERLMRLG